MNLTCAVLRRAFLAQAAAVATAAAAVRGASARSTVPSPFRLVDTNVHLDSWVVRRSVPDSTARLAETLRRHGVTSAWTGSFEAVLHTDISGANARLAEACARDGSGVLEPFGTVNPTFPDWAEDVRRCDEVHRMRGLRLYPNYHGYALDDPRFIQLLEACTRRGLLVQIALTIEDDRSQNPIVTAAPVQAAPLVDVLATVPGARVMLLNGGSRVLAASSPLLQRLVAAGVYFEIATLEGVAGVEALLQRAAEIRLTFGSHTPYFYFEAALLKLQESALTPAQLTAVCAGNAEAALAERRRPARPVSPNAAPNKAG